MPFSSSLSHYAWLLAALAACACTAAEAATPQELVEQSARRHLLAVAERAGLNAPQVRVQALARGAAATCPDSVKVEPLDTRMVSRMRFAVVCSSTPDQRVEFVVRGTLTAEVVVVSEDVQANRPIAAEQLTLERRDVSAVVDPMPDIESVVGKSSRRALRAGQVVSGRWLVEPVLVKRGTRVNIVARNAGVEVQVAGEALESGRRNEVIRVRNAGNGAEIRARVVDENVVEPVSTAQSQD